MITQGENATINDRGSCARTHKEILQEFPSRGQTNG